MLDNKVPPLIVLFLIAFLMWTISMITPEFTLSESILSISAILFFLIGIFFSVSGVLAFKQAQTTTDPRVPENSSKIVKTGIYNISRNPMYVGFAFFLLSWSMVLSSPSCIIGIIFFIIYLNRFQIETEERILTDKFGEQYKSYLKSVRRWL